MSQFLRATCALVIAALLYSVQAFNPRGLNARRLSTSLKMADISAKMVGELRAKTDAPMMECKKALIEASGDMVRAEEILRVKLGNKATKVGNRIAAEGLVIAKIEGNKGVLFEANCETDFVSKNPDFVAFTKAVTDKILVDAPADITTLNAMSMGGKTVEGTRSDLVGKIGENMSLRRFKRFDTPTSKLASYVHGSRIGVIVEYEGDEEAAKDVAMHIAAQKPICMTPEQVPPENAARERKIATEKAAESGKPKEIVEKMVEGSVQKYLKEVSLMNQPFVKNDKQSVAEMLKQKKTVLKSFELYVVGDGLEKKQDNFVAEVQAAQAKVQAAAAAATK